MKYLLFLLLAIGTALYSPRGVFAQLPTADTTSLDFPLVNLPPQMRWIRIWGGDDERRPPIIAIGAEVPLPQNVVSDRIVIEFDIFSELPPFAYATFIHCSHDWQEDNNVFVNDLSLRTSNFEWYQAPPGARWYSWRGRLEFPSMQIKFRHSGNWKVKIWSMEKEGELLLGEARFFVVDARVQANLSFASDFYQPQAPVSPSAWSLELDCRVPATFLDNQVSKAVFYRNGRWGEPFIVEQGNSSIFGSGWGSSGGPTTQVFGAAGGLKRFRINAIPAQAMYRVLDLTNLTRFPTGLDPIRLPLADLPRNGVGDFLDNDGVAVTRWVEGIFDDYVNVEFVLDPLRFPSKYDVYVVGSFNNWTPSPQWQMRYDKEKNLYTLRQMVRRGVHDYLYATGRLGAKPTDTDALNFEEYEGNSLNSGHSFYGFLYHRDINWGGYDAIIGIAGASPTGMFRR